MNKNKQISDQEITILKVIAWLFIIDGSYTILKMLYLLTQSHININLLFVTLIAGIGLWNKRPWSLILSKIVLWTIIILVGLGLILRICNFHRIHLDISVIFLLLVYIILAIFILKFLSRDAVKSYLVGGGRDNNK